MSERARLSERIVALDSATPIGSVALLEGSRLIAERSVDEPQRHAATLLGALDELLRSTHERLDDYGLIALSVGPGSFTGLRVGLALALGLCFGTQRRILPVSTLAALARAAGPVPRVAPMLDARRGQIYAGLYGPDVRPILEDRVCDPGPWLETLPEFVYFSFVSLTTLGYGDISPATPIARFVVYLEAILGQLYLAIMVAGLVGIGISDRVRNRSD